VAALNNFYEFLSCGRGLFTGATEDNNDDSQSLYPFSVQSFIP